MKDRLKMAAELLKSGAFLMGIRQLYNLIPTGGTQIPKIARRRISLKTNESSQLAQEVITKKTMKEHVTGIISIIPKARNNRPSEIGRRETLANSDKKNEAPIHIKEKKIKKPSSEVQLAKSINVLKQNPIFLNVNYNPMYMFFQLQKHSTPRHCFMRHYTTNNAGSNSTNFISRLRTWTEDTWHKHEKYIKTIGIVTSSIGAGVGITNVYLRIKSSIDENNYRTRINVLPEPQDKSRIIKRHLTREIRKLIEVNSMDKNIVKIVISGVEGSGKSELAAQYLNEYYHYTEKVTPGKVITTVMLHADNLEILANEYKCFAEDKLKLDIRGFTYDEIIQAVHAALNNREGWILVFDNVNKSYEIDNKWNKDTIDGYSAIQKYFPTGNNQKGQIVVTTREQDSNLWKKNALVIDLNSSKYRLAESEAVSLFDKAMRDSSQKHKWLSKAKLVRELGYLPISIARAALYIASNETETIDSYITKFRNIAKIPPENILDCKDADLINNTVINISLEKFDDRDKRLLSFLVFLNVDNIEENILLHQQILNYMQNKHKINQRDLIDIVTRFKAYGIFDKNQPYGYKIHRSLISPVIELGAEQEWKSQNQQGSFASYSDKNQFILKYKMAKIGELLEYCAEIFSPDNLSRKNLETNKSIVAHTQTLLAHFESLKDQFLISGDNKAVLSMIQILDAMANYFNSSANNYLLAEKILNKGNELLEQQIKVLYNGKITIKDDYITHLNIHNGSNFDLIYAYVRILYSLGRMYHYKKDNENKFKYLHYLIKAKKIAELMAQNGHQPIFESILILSNGFLYHDLDSNNTEDLKRACENYEAILNDEGQYINRNRQIIIPKGHIATQLESRNQAAKCYLKLATLDNFFKRKEHYNNALLYLAGGKYKNEAYKGAIELAQENDEYITRLPNYLNTLASILLLHEYSNDNAIIKKLFKDSKNTDLCKLFISLGAVKNNLEIAELVLKSSQELYGDRPATYTLVDTLYLLARVYHAQNRYQEAKLEIDACVDIQVKQLKRTDKHADLDNARNLQEQIDRELRIKPEFEF